MRKLVIDASATLDWLFDENGAKARIRPVLESYELVAPSLWRLDVANAILVRERRRLLSAAAGTQLLQILDELPIELVTESDDVSASSLAQTARPHQLSAYDAVYLGLAVRFGLLLFTHDNNLRAAAKRIGVGLVDERDAPPKQ